MLEGQGGPNCIGRCHAAHAEETRSIQLLVQDQYIGPLLAAQGWDGALAPLPDADFLAVVDTNMGFNKVDAVIERSLAYTITWPTGADTQPSAGGRRPADHGPARTAGRRRHHLYAHLHG